MVLDRAGQSRGSTPRSSSRRGDPIASELVKNVNFEHAASMVLISLAKTSAPEGMPDALAIDPEVRTRSAGHPRPRRQGEEGGRKLQPGLASTRSGASARRSRRCKTRPTPRIPQGTPKRDESDNFLKALYGLSKMLERPQVEQFLKGLNRYPTTTLGRPDLVHAQLQPSVRSWRRRPQQEAAYDQLYPMLVQLRNQSQGQGPNPLTVQTPLPDPKGATSFFSGMDYSHFGPQPDPHTGVVPLRPSPNSRSEMDVLSPRLEISYQEQRGVRLGTHQGVTRMRLASVWFGLVGLAICQGSGAQEPAKAEKAAPTTRQPEDASAIASLVATFTKAFNAGDAASAAATYAENALVVDERGERTEGRAAVRDQLAASFAESPGATIAIKVNALRFLGPDTALEEGRTTITPAGAGGVPEVTRFTVVYVKNDGRWLQSAVRDETVHDLTPHDRLKELEWLVGEWINESQDAVVNTTCKWTDNGNFLTREFTMKTHGRPVLSGSQRIGWDPVRKQFKTWIFDTEGGFGEGYFSRNGDEWVIKAEGVRQDGRHASVTNILKRLGKDRASWQSVDRTLGDVAMPGIDEFTLVRKPPEAAR